MASPKIRAKRSSVEGKVPSTTQLERGEFAVNTYDGKVYVVKDQYSVGIATTTINVNPWAEPNGIGAGVSYSGSVTATSFAGDGSALTGLSTFSGNYNHLSNKPTIPTNNNQLTNGAGYVTENTQLSNEQVQDIVGAMLTGNTESGITVTYQDSNGTIDFSVASQTEQNFTNADHSKLDGIEAGATGDQTDAEIRAAVEAATDSNVFTDADHAKLNGIAAGAQVNVATDLGTSFSTTSVTITSSTGSNTTISEADTSNAGVMSVADHNKLANIEANATADQTAAEIRTLVGSASDSNVFTDADHSKLDGIEAGATADQTASEILSLLSNQTITTTGDIKVNSISKSVQVGDISGDNYLQLIQENSNSVRGFTNQHSNASVFENVQGTTNQHIVLGDVNTDSSNTLFGVSLTQSGSTSTRLNLSGSGNLNVHNNITLGGTVDGRDIASDGSKLDGIASGATNVTNNNQLTNGAGYITGYTVTSSDVTQHEGDITITESQISDLGTYLTSSDLSSYATQSYVNTQVSNLVDSAPSTLNTLNELAAALGDDANFSTTVTSSIAAKMPLAGGTFTGAVTFASGQTFDYGNLTNTPTIPSNNNQLTNGAGYITGYTVTSSDVTGHQGDITITESQISDFGTYATTASLATVATSGSYNDLSNKPTIPTNNNQLTNGAGYVTANTQLSNEQVQDIVGGMVSSSLSTQSGITVTYGDSDGVLNFAVASQTDNNFTNADHSKLDGIASGATNVTNNNQLTNGAGYITGYTVTSSDVTQHEGDITITESQISDFGTYATTGSLATVATSGSYNDLSNTPTIPTNNNQLTNGAGYITDITTQTDSKYIRSNANDNVSAHTEWQDNKEIRLGNGADFRMDFNGSDTIFRNYAHANGDIIFQGENTSGTNQNLMKLKTDTTRGYVELYENSDVRLTTVNGGVHITGNLTATADITSEGATYFSNMTAPSAAGSSKIYATTEGGANNGTLALVGQDKIAFIEGGFSRWHIDDGALVTHGTTYNNLGNASTSGGRVGNGYFQYSVDLIDDGELRLGNGDDLKLRHDGSSSYIENATGNLLTRVPGGNLFAIQKSGGTENIAIFNADGAVELYHNNSQKFITTSSGATVTGTLTATSFSGDGSSLTGITASNADTVDSLHASSFLRSDANDTGTGQLTLQRNSASVTDFSLHIRNAQSAPAQIKFSNNSTTQNGYFFYRHEDSQSNSAANSFHFNSDQTSTAVIIDQTAGNSGFYVGTNEVWHAGNDGASSGLDADLLDGSHGADYLDYNNFTNTPTIPTNNNQLTNGAGYITDITTQTDGKYLRSNANDEATGQITLSGGVSTNGKDVYTDNGALISSDAAGAFSSRTGTNIDHIWHNDSTNTWHFCSDTSYKNTGNSTVRAGAFSAAGNTVWHAGNDGSGSGLDADKLDGIQASSFLRSDVSDTSSRMRIFYTNLSSQDDYQNSPISIRERDAAAAGDGEDRDAPNLNFHWGGRVSNSLWMKANGHLNWGSYNSSGVPSSDGHFKTGNVTVSGDLTSNSDISLKDNVVTYENALDKILAMRGVEYDRNDLDGKHEVGLIAQEVEKIIPEVVGESEDGIKNIAYGKLTAVLIEAIKEQQQQINDLRQQLNKGK